ncbi:hypothetical protein SDC9_88408 [bioreactor metagenome]|uniref:Uncharacterized protein n=1 Tax=bioreactor metagenome TaxID=1076179 RepID=A0A644ZLH1_9ZZZZ
MPPFVGVAVKVTLVPAQMLDPRLAAILTLTGRLEFTVMFSVFDVAGLPVAQVAFDVTTQYTASLFDRVLFV